MVRQESGLHHTIESIEMPFTSSDISYRMWDYLSHGVLLITMGAPYYESPVPIVAPTTAGGASLQALQ